MVHVCPKCKRGRGAGDETGWYVRDGFLEGMFKLTFEGNVGVNQKNKGERLFKLKE